MLTGESVPTSKEVGKAVEPAAPLGDRKNMCYSATNVVSGQAEAVVVGTGDSAEIGQISRMVNTVRVCAGRGRGLGFAVRHSGVVPVGGGEGRDDWPTHPPHEQPTAPRTPCTHRLARCLPHHNPPHIQTNTQVETVHNNLERQLSVFGRWLAVMVVLVRRRGHCRGSGWHLAVGGAWDSGFA